MTQVVERLNGRLTSLDDDLTREAAQADPAGFLRQNPDGLLAIDEVQRVPALVLALKLTVDQDPRPGRFLLTGSANLLRLPTMQDSLAGRAENVNLLGFSQGELNGTRERFVDRFLTAEPPSGKSADLTRVDYLTRACAGGYPEALVRAPGRRRSAWFDNYLRRIVERDAPDVSGLQRLRELPSLRPGRRPFVGRVRRRRAAPPTDLVGPRGPALPLPRPQRSRGRLHPRDRRRLRRRDRGQGHLHGHGPRRQVAHPATRSAGASLVAGVVMHTGTTTAPFGPRIHAVPIGTLWAV